MAGRLTQEDLENTVRSMHDEAARIRAQQVETNPDDPAQVGEALKVGRDLGISPDAVLTSPDAYRSILSQRQTEDILKKSPILSDWLGQDVKNQALAKPDLEGLSALERVGVSASDPATFIGDVFNSLGRSLSNASAEGAKESGQRVVGGAASMISQVLRARGNKDENLAFQIQQQAPERIKELDRQAAVYQSILDRGMSDDGVSPMTDEERELYTQRLTEAREGIEQWVDVEEFGPAFAGNRGGKTEPASMAFENWVRDTFGEPPPADSLWDYLMDGLGSMIPFVATSLAPGGFALTAQMGADAARMGAFDEAKAAGATDEEAYTAANIMGFIGTSEAVPISMMLNRISAPMRGTVLSRLGRFVINAGKGSFEEGVQEGFQAFMGNLTRREVYDPNTPLWDDDATMETIVGAILGAFFSGVIDIAQEPRLRPQVPEAANLPTLTRPQMRDLTRASMAGQTASTLDQIDQIVAQTQMKDTAPEKLEEFADRVAGDQALYVPAQDVEELFQSKNLPVDDATLAEWGVEREEFDSALISGGDVVIPLSKYATRIAGTQEAAWFKENATMNPDAMSMAEARRMIAEAEQARQNQDDQADFNEEEQARVDARVEAEQAIYDNIYLQAREAGATPEVASVQARVMTAMRNSLMDQWGADAWMDRGYDRVFTPRYRRTTVAEAQQERAGGRVIEQGRPANLAERTDTPEFRKWFGDSKVVDEQGQPLVVYHGGVVGIEQFENPNMRWREFMMPEAAERVVNAVYFTDSRRAADTYVERSRNRANEDRDFDREIGVHEVYLSIQNPMIVDMGGKRFEMGSQQALIDQARDGGHDGIIVRNVVDDYHQAGDPVNVYVTFDPAQIKSVNNRGTFDSSDPRILYQGLPDGWEKIEVEVEMNDGEVGVALAGEVVESLDARIEDIMNVLRCINGS